MYLGKRIFISSLCNIATNSWEKGRDKMTDKKQMKLANFCKEFDIARTTALKWAHSDGFPAYNLCGHWYVDMDKFYKWRDQQHKKSYKYA